MFVKAREKKLYEEVVKQIKYLINTKQLKDGDMLPSEDELSKSIGVSRATVREGLRILELLGLVETKRGKGTFVRINNLESFKNKLGHSLDSIGMDSYYVHEIDRLLEPSVARLVAQKGKDEEIQKIKLALEKMEESINKGESGEDESLYFHKVIIDALNNPILNSIFELTREIHERGRKIVLNLPNRAQETLKEHYKIYEAIRDRNANKAYQYMERHLTRVSDTYDKIFILKNFKEIDK